MADDEGPRERQHRDHDRPADELGDGELPPEQHHEHDAELEHEVRRDTNLPIDGGRGSTGISNVDFPSPRRGIRTFADDDSSTTVWEFLAAHPRSA